MSVFSDVYVRNLLNVEGKIISNDATPATVNGASVKIKGGILVQENSIFNNSVTIEGDLTVNGTTKTVNKETLNIADPYITLAKGNNANEQNIGILMEYKNDNDVEYSGLYRKASDKSFYVFNNASGLPNEVFSTGAEPEPADYANFNASVIKAHSDDDSTNSTTGALIVSGGVGIAKNLNVGKDVKIESDTSSTTTTTGALVVNGGVGIGENLHATGLYAKGLAVDEVQANDVTVDGEVGTNTLDVNKDATIRGDKSSTDSTNGALVVAGGVGIGENLNVGKDVKILSATSSTSTSTGALVVTGGVGISENLYVGEKIEANNINASTINSTFINSTTLSNKDIIDTEKLVVSGATSSTSTSTGALVVTGGVGISENLNVGGSVNITGSLTADSIVVTDFEVDKLSTEIINVSTELKENCKAVIFASETVNVTLPSLTDKMRGKLIQIVNVGAGTVTVEANTGDNISTFYGNVPISPWASLSLVGYFDGDNKRWIIR